MKHLSTAALLALLPTLAFAEAPSPLGASGGKFGDWTAATFGTGAATVCYAFTTPQISKPNWKTRGKAMLTVTERSGVRDEVTLTPGYTYPQKATVSLTIGKQNLPFYISGGTAFTTDGAQIIAAFRKADSATAKSTGPHGHPVEDQFSLTGFSAAYAAITHACP
jgi:hypothetical protein